MAGPSRRQRHGPPAPPAAGPSRARPPGSAAQQPGGLGRAHARGAPGRAGHTPPTHSESLSLPALAPSPSGVSQSLPRRCRRVSASPSHPLRGGGAGSPGRGRQRKSETDSIKFPETTAARKGPRRGRLPVFPAPLQSLRDRCRWSGVGEPASAAAVAPVRRSSGLARSGSGSGSFGGGGCCCGAVPPVNCLRPRAARQPHSAEGRREPPPPPPRAAEDVVSCGASASSPAGTLWKRVGPDPRGAFAWSAEAAPGGAAAASHARLSPLPPGLASFRLPAGPPSEFSKLGALGGGDGGSAGETPRHVRGGRPWAGRGGAAPGPPRPPRPPPGRPRGPGAGRATALRALSPRAPAGAGEAAAAAAARAAGQACVLRCAPGAAFPGRARNLCGSPDPRSLRAFSLFFFFGSRRRNGPAEGQRRAGSGDVAGKCPPGSSG